MAKRALLVGINDYKNISDLKGCINDVTNIRGILKTYYGFTNNDIRVLVDTRATKEAILHRLKQMVSQTKAGDLLIFHFSGHGSQIRDRNGDEKLKDNLDELICPYDMNWDNGFITDDMLDEIFKKLPTGAFLEVFLDCCHSGTGLRSGFSFSSSNENQMMARYLPPPPDIELRAEGEEDELKARKFSLKSGQVYKQVLWAACKSDQTAADARIEGTFNGAFTFYFCKHIREAQGKISRKDLLARLKDSLKQGRFSQIPQLECEKNLREMELLKHTK